MQIQNQMKVNGLQAITPACTSQAFCKGRGLGLVLLEFHRCFYCSYSVKTEPCFSWKPIQYQLQYNVVLSFTLMRLLETQRLLVPLELKWAQPCNRLFQASPTCGTGFPGQRRGSANVAGPEWERTYDTKEWCTCHIPPLLVVNTPKNSQWAAVSLCCPLLLWF